jgi:hypothetical protein
VLLPVIYQLAFVIPRPGFEAPESGNAKPGPEQMLDLMSKALGLLASRKAEMPASY